jgi:GNAT superfamily N-acetyltransferase
MRIVKNCGIEDEASWQRGLESYFARALGSGRVLAWLCLDGGATVATAALRVDSVREGRGPHGAREGYVMSVYTMAPWRRLGISTRLLGEVIAEARSIGLVRLVLHPTEDALPLYRGLGFHEFRTVMILPL